MAQRKVKYSKVKYSSTAAAEPPPAAPLSKKQALIDIYGEKNVAEYENKFKVWAAKKGGNIRVDMYVTISKWLEQDGVVKSQNTSSFDTKEVMDNIISRYKTG